MARGDQLGRQWQILQLLTGSRTGKSVSEIADRIGCHARTVYRDLNALQVAGFPLYTHTENRKKMWGMLDAAKQHLGAPFNLTELMALYLGRDMLKMLQNTIFHESIESLFKKVKATLSESTVAYLEEFGNTVKVSHKPYLSYPRINAILQTVNDAALGKKMIQITYHSMHPMRETQREVAPFRIWFFGGMVYLIGFCQLRQEIRTFAVDRIKQARLTEQSFEIPASFNFDEYMKGSFGVYSGEPRWVKVWFAKDIAGLIKEKVWHESQRITELEDGAILFEAHVSGIDEIKSWILKWGAKAFVITPESLQHNIMSESEKLAAMYAKGGPPEINRSAEKMRPPKWS